ncbi:MAG TPA: M1 family aminopeptidase, partial [Thermoanaerobaculia bacterium]
MLQLPGDVRPTHYALSMEIVPSRERFRGAADIDIRLERPRTVLWLHGRDLHVSASTVGDAAAAYEQVNPEGLVRLVLSSPVGPGDARIHLEWDAPFDPRIVGLYLAHEAGEAYAFTQFESVDARRAFPGFDEPLFKTPFDVTLTVPASHVAIANTLPTEEAPAGDGLKRVRFATTQPLPTYLLIWAVGPFDVVAPPPLPPNEVRHRPLPVRGVAPRGRGAELATALETGAAQLVLQEKYFGVPFPFEKLDHIAAPDYTYGAMENAGGILYREELLLFKPGVSSEDTRRAIGSVMAHEISHQWFGDLVTLRWWTDAWLNESFATWMGTRTEEEWDPSMRAGLYQLTHGHKAMAIDALKSARAVRQPLDDVKNIWNQFDAITYEKGAMVLSMFERFVGEEKFRAGIHAYLASHAYGSGDTGELLDALSQAAGRDVKAAFQTFLDQPGMPIVDVRATCEREKGKLRLEQARYVPLGSDGSREGAWKIPICVHYGAAGGTRQACTLLEARTGELALDSCPEWVMPNADAAGYYRWSLPAPELQELSGGAYPQLSARERLSLADNVRAAMRSGRLAFADGVPAIAAMARDPDPQVAATPFLLLKE